MSVGNENEKEAVSGMKSARPCSHPLRGPVHNPDKAHGSPSVASGSLASGEEFYIASRV